MDEIRVVGKDVWWDHKLKRFRKKRLNLEKVPMKYRCPNCGGILEGTGYYDRREDNYPLPFPTEIELRFNGGVCRKCCLDGFGKYGERGKVVSEDIKRFEESQKKFEGLEEVWVNGRLRWSPRVIRVEKPG